MELISNNLDKAKENPSAVPNGQLKGISSSESVTIWVDTLGRVQRFHLAPHSIRDGNEHFLMTELNEANAKALRAAENLDFDGTEESSYEDQERAYPAAPTTVTRATETRNPTELDSEDCADEPPESFLV